MPRFDAIVCGTGITEALVAGALAKAGKRVCHVDFSNDYGDSGAVLSMATFISHVLDSGGVVDLGVAEDASGLAEAIVDTAKKLPKGQLEGLTKSVLGSTCEEIIETRETDQLQKKLMTLVRLLEDSRKYSIELTPKLILAGGQLVDTMIAANVSNYLEFRSVDGIHVLIDGKIQKVPCSKEDVFKNNDIPLLEKRKIMRLLSSVSEEAAEELLTENGDESFIEYLEKQGLSAQSQAIIYFGAAHFPTWSYNVSKKDGFAALKRFLAGIGRFCASPLLSGVYGTSSEIAQAFSRVCAVHGGTYMLGLDVIEARIADGDFILKLKDMEDPDQEISSKYLISSPRFADRFKNNMAPLLEKPTRNANICVCAVEEKISWVGEPGMLVIPGSTSGQSAIFGIQHSDVTSVCPTGKYMVVLATVTSDESKSAKGVLEPILGKLLTLGGNMEAQPLLTAFYTEHVMHPESATNNFIITAGAFDWSLGLEEAVADARRVFNVIVPDAPLYPSRQEDAMEESD